MAVGGHGRSLKSRLLLLFPLKWKNDFRNLLECIKVPHKSYQTSSASLHKLCLPLSAQWPTCRPKPSSRHTHALWRDAATSGTANKPCRIFSAPRHSSDECRPWQWAIPATPTSAARFVGSLDCYYTTASCRRGRAFSPPAVVRFVSIVGWVLRRLWVSLWGVAKWGKEKLSVNDTFNSPFVNTCLFAC